MLSVLLMFWIRIFVAIAGIKFVGSFFLNTPLVVTVFDFETVNTEISTWKY